LVLDGGDSALRGPVKRVSVGLREDGGLLLDLSSLAAQDSLVLGVSPVRELIVACAIVLARSVVLLDPFMGGGEVLEAHQELSNRLELSVELGNVGEIVEVCGHFKKLKL